MLYFGKKKLLKKINIFSFGLIVISFLFILSFCLRYEYIGTLSDDRDQWITAHSLLIIDNWFEDGIFNNRFLGITIPNSIEFNSISERFPYISYPGGAQIIIYIIKLLFPSFETLKIIHYYGFLNQYLISLIIFFIVLNFKFKNRDIKILFATFAGSSYIFFPFPYYSHIGNYFSDTAVILFLVIIYYLEVKIQIFISRGKLPIHLYLSQTFFLTIAAFIDYVAISAALVIFIMRFIHDFDNLKKKYYLIKNFLQLVLPVILVFSFYFLYLHNEGYGENLYNVFLQRAAFPNSINENFFYNLLNNFLLFFIKWKSWSIYIIPMIFCYFYFFYRYLKSKSIHYYIAIIGFSVGFVHLLLLSHHSSNHEFSTLKFYVPISIGFFGTMPLSIFSLNKTKLVNFFFKERLIFIYLLIFYSFFICAKFIFTGKTNIFPKPYVKNSEFAYLIKEHAKFEYVYLTNNKTFEIQNLPPQMLAISKKKVYYFSNYNSLIIYYNKILKLNKNAIFIFTLDHKDYCFPFIQNKFENSIRSQKYFFYKLDTKSIGYINECFK